MLARDGARFKIKIRALIIRGWCAPQMNLGKNLVPPFEFQIDKFTVLQEAMCGNRRT